MVGPGKSYVRWYLIGWLFVLSAVAFLDRVNLSIAAPSLGAAYRLNKVELGPVFSAFLWGYAAFQTIGGRLADKIGSRKVLALCVIWWGAFTALTAAIPTGIKGSLLLLVLVRFLLGAGEAVMYPASNQFISRWIPDRERGIANGWIFAGVGAGSAISPPMITYLMLHYGWRSSFWLCAVIGLLAGLIWFAVARDAPEKHPQVSGSELEIIRRGISFGKPVETGHLVPWRAILKSRDVWAITISYFTFGYVAWIFFSWFFTYLLEARNLNLKASALYGTLPFLAIAACSPTGGLFSDWLTRKHNARVGRCLLAATAIAMAGIFLLLGAEAHEAHLASIVLAGGAGALYLAQSSFWSVTAGLAGSSSGSVSGFMNMGAQIGGAISTLLTPAIADWFGWTAAFLVAAGLCLLGAAAWMIVDPERTLATVPKAISAQTS
jgi:ACS family glucarate transporter-like MFS transporter